MKYWLVDSTKAEGGPAPLTDEEQMSSSLSEEKEKLKLK